MKRTREVIQEKAAEIAATVAGNLATEYVSPYVSYFFSFGKIVEDFKDRRNELLRKMVSVQNKVDEAMRQTEVIEKDVEDWLTRAKKELEEAQSLEAQIDSNKRFKWCPNLGWRYRLSMKLAKKTLEISKLLGTSDFSRVGRRAPLEGIEFLLSEDFMVSESSKLAFNEIMKALNSDDVNMIGLYGMPGVGKTSLVKEVGKQAMQQKLFDQVVMITVSQTPNINIIQHRIAEILDLTFKAKTEGGKAEELLQRLKNKKKFLIIVDDIWKKFDLRTIGIPRGDDHKAGKVLLTTRLQQVCIQMDCHEIKLNGLSENEAWALFKVNASLKDASSTLNDVAKEVAGECKGLPLAIVTVAQALKGESLDGWTAANQRLKDARHLDNQDVCEDIYKLLKLSYDYLGTNNIQSCFLLCSLFPEDHDINVELLFICGIGVGLFSNIYFIEDARREIRVALRKLQKSGLLLETNSEKRVRMHDVVRDFAHWLTSIGENKFMVKDGLTEWPMIESPGCCTAIALWNCSNIKYFPDKVEFPRLKTLFLMGKKSLQVPSSLFEEMKALQVLVLKKIVFPLGALQCLTNLRTLCFMDCQLENMSSSFRSMGNLEILALFGTNICKLPEELVKLPKLKVLYFSHRKELLNFPAGLLSRLTSLQELHVTSKNNINLLELNSLPSLTALALSLSTGQCFQENFVFPRLKSYVIVVNRYGGYLAWLTFGRYLEGITYRTLNIEDLSLNAFKNLFCNVEKLYLQNVSGPEILVPNIITWGANELTSVVVTCCKDMESFIDITGELGPTILGALRKIEKVIVVNCERLQVVFQMGGFFEKVEGQTPLLSNLTSLCLESLPKLESIWKLEPSHHAIAGFQNLQHVTVEACDKLKSIFPNCLAQSLLHLRTLHISFCRELEQVFGSALEEEMIEPEHGDPLRWPKLKDLLIENCKSLKYVFPNTSPQGLPCLESVRIYDCPQLIQIFSPTEEKDIIGSGILLKLPSLQRLDVRNCPQLTFFIVQARLMKDLYLSDVGNSCQSCNSGFPILNEDSVVVGNHEEVFRVQDGSSLSGLRRLDPEDLFEVRLIWKDLAEVVTLENLTTLRVIDCKKLRYIFSPATARGLSRLAFLEIKGCNELEQIMLVEDQVSSSSNGVTGLQPISFPNLSRVTVKNCKKLKSLFPLGSARVLPKLEWLMVGDSELEQVFKVEDEAEVTAKKEIKFDNLKKLSLQGLPGLVDFCPKGYHFVLSTLAELTVEDCPTMTTSFFIDSKNTVHCKTETPRPVEQDVTEGSSSATNAIRNNNINWNRRMEGVVLPLYMEE